MNDSIVCLQGAIRHFAWGSHAVIAQLQGRPAPTREPEAELWFGAHPLAPAHVLGGQAPRTLDDLVASDPHGVLGPEVAAAFDQRLPYLLKILAVEQPLSLQVHPGAEQARRGFAREEADGPARDAPSRTYRDPRPKPELLVALTPVDALCGFGEVSSIIALLRDLDVPALRPIADTIAGEGPRALAGIVARLLTWPADERDALVGAVEAAARRVAAAGGVHAPMARWVVRLAAQYPGDPGVAVVLLLELIRLAPGESIFVPAGALHAYLHGTGVEVMANSDNVLRGGLTAKHVDVPGLLDVLGEDPVRAVSVAARHEGAEQVFDTPTPPFRLARIDLDAKVVLDRRGPEMLLAVDGPLEVAAGDGDDAVAVERGQAAFLPAGEGTLTIRGEGRVFRASIGPR